MPGDDDDYSVFGDAVEDRPVTLLDNVFAAFLGLRPMVWGWMYSGSCWGGVCSITKIVYASCLSLVEETFAHMSNNLGSRLSQFWWRHCNQC